MVDIQRTVNKVCLNLLLHNMMGVWKGEEVIQFDE